MIPFSFFGNPDCLLIVLLLLAGWLAYSIGCEYVRVYRMIRAEFARIFLRSPAK